MLSIEQKEVLRSLSKYVSKISLFKSDGPITQKHRLIPSGCSYLSYNHKDIPVFLNAKRVRPIQRLQITGPKTDPNISVDYEGDLFQLLVEFTPTGFYYLFHDSPGNYLNKLIDLTQFVPVDSVDRLTGQLQETDNPTTQSAIIQDYLTELAFQASPFCTYIEEAIEIIHARNGNVLIKDLARAIHKSERQFNRQFNRMVGISPKEFCKLVQLHYVINLMNLKEFSSFKEISYSANFYDLSHFDHRFKELVGITPNEFLTSKEHNALKYFTDLVKPLK